MDDRKQMKKKGWIIVYFVIFYFVWTIGHFFIEEYIDCLFSNQVVNQIIKSGIIKNLIWTLPAILLVKRYKNQMFISLEEMFTNKVNLIKYIPFFLGFTAYILGSAIIYGDIKEFHMPEASALIIVIFVGITEETVFRGLILNATITDTQKWEPILLNSILFLAIHFPRWLMEGQFFSSILSFGSISVVILSVIFSWTFIKSKSIIVPITLHMYWDLLMFMF